MEFAGKIKLTLILLISLSLVSCVSVNNEKPIDVLVLEEITPMPKSVQKKQQVLYEPVYGIMRVLEISLENGVQTEILTKKGNITTGLEKGAPGDIAVDAGFNEIIGNCKIVSVQNGFVTFHVENVTKKIPSNAYIRIITGQKIKEE